MIGRHACLHTENIHGGDILFPNEHTLNRLTIPPMEHMLNGYDDSALNGVGRFGIFCRRNSKVSSEYFVGETLR